MRIGSKRTNYGILVAIDLATQATGEPVQARTIARRQAIPVRVLEHVLTAMKRAGLVESTRGVQGGYLLRKRPEELSVAQIIEALDGPPVVPVTASRAGSPVRRGIEQHLLLSAIWARVQQVEMDLLNRIMLSELVEEYRVLHQRGSPMYHI
ncbi:transcriptional regulator [Nitrospira sp.]|nr:transcriptional regulator [Nitrospira sp.]